MTGTQRSPTRLPKFFFVLNKRQNPNPVMEQSMNTALVTAKSTSSTRYIYNMPGLSGMNFFINASAMV